MWVTLEEHLEREFSESARPCHKTAVSWIKKDKYPAVSTRIGGRYFIFVPAGWDAPAPTGPVAVPHRRVNDEAAGD